MPKVTLSGALHGDYVVREARPDGTLVLVPMMSENANGLPGDGTGTTPDEPVALVAGDDRALVAPGLAAVLQDAVTQAVRLRYGYLGSEHLLLALANVRSGLASDVLVTFGVSAPRVAKIIQEIVPPGTEDHDYRELPFTPRARDASPLRRTKPWGSA